MNTTHSGEIEELSTLLKEKGLTLAVAESCSAGLLGFKLTSVAGSSKYFKGGIISYADSAKIDLLGITNDLLDNYGAVSKECAQLMALRIREKLDSDIGVSITGVAGPGGGTKEKPVGTVFISLSVGKNIITERLSLSGERNEIREQAVSAAIKLITKEL